VLRIRLGMECRPHFFVVPVLWRCISLVPDKWLRAKLLTRATKLVNQVVLAPDSPVHTAPEAHVLFHTSTAAVGTVYGAELAKRFADPRYVHLVFEGAGGDPRQRSEWRQSRYLAPGLRSIVVPYFVEPRDTLSHWLAQWCPSACASTKQSIQRAGSGGVVYLRCSSNGHLRPRLVGAFAETRGADVALIESARNDSSGASTSYGRMNRELRLATFLAGIAALRNSIFCLVPLGVTASSRRLYEALDAGCIPVVVSDRITLPFASNPSVRWSDGVIFHPEAAVNGLPKRLASVTPAEIAGRRAAVAVPARQVTYSQGRAAEFVWLEMINMTQASKDVRSG
jgi:hypothetical protein